MAIRRQISKDIAQVLQMPDLKKQLEAIGFHTSTTTPEEQDKRLRADIAAFAKVMKDIGLKAN